MNNIQNIFLKYFSVENLKLAWERMLRSNGKDIKDVFGIEIYASNLDKNLLRLSNHILEGNFHPQRPFKYYEPKESKTHRTKSILSVEDALVYQAIANVVAAKNFSRLAGNNSFVFGSILHPEVEKGTGLLNEPDADLYDIRNNLEHRTITHPDGKQELIRPNRNKIRKMVVKLFPDVLRRILKAYKKSYPDFINEN